MPDKRYSVSILAVLVLSLSVSCLLFTPTRGPLRFDPVALPDAQVGLPYEARITISENATPAGEFSISEGALPTGLTLEKVQGTDSVRILGVPSAAGTFRFKVYVWCYGTNVSGQVGEKEYSLIVK